VLLAGDEAVEEQGEARDDGLGDGAGACFFWGKRGFEFLKFFSILDLDLSEKEEERKKKTHLFPYLLSSRSRPRRSSTPPCC
jgi:hypothetical protein